MLVLYQRNYGALNRKVMYEPIPRTIKGAKVRPFSLRETRKVSLRPSVGIWTEISLERCRITRKKETFAEIETSSADWGLSGHTFMGLDVIIWRGG